MSVSVAQWVDACQSWVRAPSKAPVVYLSKKLSPHGLILVGSRNGLERDLHKQKQFFKENPSHLSYFSVGKMRGSSHLAQKQVA